MPISLINAVFDEFLPDTTKDLRKTLQDTLAAKAQDQPPKVVACGLLKAGKSSLLNALSGHLKTEYFGTGATRTTIENKEFSNHQFTFIDTPGWDAKDPDDENAVLDDEESLQAIRTADVLLFVHDPNTGELHREEIKILKKLKNQPGATAKLDERLLLVLTHRDRYTKEKEVIDDITEKVCKQVEEYIGIKPQFFQVSYTTYRKGSLENKPALIEHSGLPVLQKHLADRSDELKAITRQVRIKRFNEVKEELLSKLVAAQILRVKARDENHRKLSAKRDELERDFNKSVKEIREKISTYNQEFS